MGKFKVGDKIRLKKSTISKFIYEGNRWWNNYKNISENSVWTVSRVGEYNFSAYIEGSSFPRNKPAYWTVEDYFEVVEVLTKEERLLNKIDMLYKKCPTTSHWSKENV